MTGTPSCPPLDPARILAALAPHAAAFALRVVDECGSTNSELVDHPPPDDGRIHVLLAERQTAGRGRRGRQWQSWPGAGLTFSALWRFAPGSPVPAGLSLVAGLALARTLEKLGVEGVQLKWPNDVLVHGAKLAGILVELLPGRGRTPAAVIGIGINLRLPAEAHIPDQPAVTDLASHCANPPERNTLAGLLLAELHGLFELYATAGFTALRGAWQQRNAFADLPVRISAENGDIFGQCAGVDEDGALLIRTEDGLTTRILSGEVSLRVAA
ncbi:biotin--[acetyl-CoA-carboxylase] ligase [Pseudothauera rhizosphaerae]|uniref:biotin--[biotin carboxyl-carrier protein] ligase n=1 Tax=Pseudothauera rhizosphaerae TaxID=2565932 RepID=A0A4S4AQ11_9RHOO|nr:biotin--[acetyl-CoA-carboxylase] ligase [Pseudothauera rhizosphaerae]THF61253.1 biotin--[acetyl-CoA-carboxylase] ligase [Pseudothauera rhizosphaerae]